MREMWWVIHLVLSVFWKFENLNWQSYKHWIILLNSYQWRRTSEPTIILSVVMFNTHESKCDDIIWDFVQISGNLVSFQKIESFSIYWEVAWYCVHFCNSKIMKSWWFLTVYYSKRVFISIALTWLQCLRWSLQ